MSNTDATLHRLAQHWRVELPQAFRQLYRAYEYPLITPCEFLSVPEMLSDEERWRGMLPQFLPFGQDGEENFYGFYTAASFMGSDYPVLSWNHEYDHYTPVASSFDAFLGYCALTGRFLEQDSDEEEMPEEESQRLALAALAGLPERVLHVPPARNERELYDQLIHADPQSAFALSQLGSRFFGQGDLQRARDCFVRASEAAPWFADPYYLLGETYRAEGQEARACGLWWQVFESPISFSSRTSNYDLGAGHTECEVYEAATDHCLACRGHLEKARLGAPLWQFLLKGDPFTSGPRFELAEQLAAAGDGAGTERELLNALTLATEEEEMDEAYRRLIDFYTRVARTRDAELCRRDAEIE